MTSAEVLDREYLEIRAKILQLAASFDRLDRSGGTYRDDARLDLIQQALATAADPAARERAEQVQLIFSRDYTDSWRQDYGLDGEPTGEIRQTAQESE